MNEVINTTYLLFISKLVFDQRDLFVTFAFQYLDAWNTINHCFTSYFLRVRLAQCAKDKHLHRKHLHFFYAVFHPSNICPLPLKYHIVSYPIF